MKVNFPELYADIPNLYTPMAVVYVKNGCCDNQPVILTWNRRSDKRINYSCQCACGGWCTNGHSTIDKAINEYLDMTKKYIQEKERRNEKFI